jgi:hypothetical protein
MKREVCCPRFHPKKWDGKTFHWRSKSFLKTTIPTFFHIPFPPMIGWRLTKMCKLAEESKKVSSNKENVLVLFTDPTPFRSEIYLSVTGKVSGGKMAHISGKFFAKVFEGGYNSIPKHIKTMNELLAKKKKKAKNYYIHYAYCPKCAKKYSHNYMVVFAEL